MQFMNSNSSILYNKFYDSVTGVPIIIDITETQSCNIHNIITLSALPSRRDGIKFPDIQGMREVFDASDVKTTNDYYCNYERGDLYLHPSRQDSDIKISYKGIGLSYIGANRVYTKQDKDGNVTETLDYIIKSGMEAIESLKIIGTAIEVLYRLEADIAEGNIVATKLTNGIKEGTIIHNALSADITEASKWKDTLHQDVTEGKVLQPKLHQEVLDAKLEDANLQQTIASATSIDDKIQTTGLPSIVIDVNDWVACTNGRAKYQYTYTHTKNTTICIVQCQIVSIDGYESGQVDSVIKDAKTIVFYTDDLCKIVGIINFVQFNGTVADLSTINADSIPEGANNKYLKASEELLIQDIPQKQYKTDDALLTTSKEVVGAINEINSEKVDKVVGKELSSNDYTGEEKTKLGGIEAQANKYTHPASHSASMIIETSTKRFVSPTEKTNWNNAKSVTDNFVTTATSIELPGGLLLQRGTITINLSGTTSNNAYEVIFEKPFATGSYSIVACNNDELNIAYNVNVNVKQVDGRSALITASIVKGAVDSIVKADWIAFGKKA